MPTSFSLAGMQTGRYGNGAATCRWSPGESHLRPASFNAIINRKRVDPTEVMIGSSNMGQQAQMGENWVPSGLKSRWLGDSHLQSRGVTEEELRRRPPPVPAQTKDVAAAREPRHKEAGPGASGEPPLDWLLERQDNARMKAKMHEQMNNLSRQPTPGRQSSAPYPPPPEPVVSDIPIPEGPTSPVYEFEGALLGHDDIPGLASRRAASLQRTPADGEFAMATALDGKPPPTAFRSATPRGTQRPIYPFQWRPDEKSLVRESYNTIVKKEQGDVTKMMIRQVTMGREAHRAPRWSPRPPIGTRTF